MKHHLLLYSCFFFLPFCQTHLGHQTNSSIRKRQPEKIQEVVLKLLFAQVREKKYSISIRNLTFFLHVQTRAAETKKI